MTPTVTPFVALDRHHEPLLDELREAFDRVLRDSSFILGAEVEAFEADFAEYCGATECVGLASGTAALTIALMAAGVGPGDEVIVPAHTYIATALSVKHAGASPVFCDVEEGSGLIDVDSARAQITSRTAAIMPVHLYGQVADMQGVTDLARRHGLLVLEDAAQAHGATYRGRRAGSLGTAAGFSFYPSKNLGALGDGGAICTSDSGLADRARQLRHLGQRRKGEHVTLGFNERLDGLHAALLRVKLPYLDGWNQQRRAVASAYREVLDGTVQTLSESPESPCIFHLFPIRFSDRDHLIQRLEAEGISCGIHYSPAVHEQPPFATEHGNGNGLQRASAWAKDELSLPIYPELEPADAAWIAELCVDTVRSYASSSSAPAR